MNATQIILPGTHYILPELPRLLRSRRHARSEDLELRHDQWLREWFPFATAADQRRFLDQRNALWTTMTYPTLDDERFYELARLTSFLFAVDDLCLRRDEAVTPRADVLFSDILAVLSGKPSDTAHGTALADIWATMGRRMPARQRCRLIVAVRGFARGCHTEMASRSTDTVLGFDRYRRLRVEHSLAAWLYFILTEYAAGVDLDDFVLDRLRPLHRIAAEHLLFANDLFSFRAEHFADDHVNAVCALVANGAGLQSTIDRMAHLIITRERDLVIARDRLLASALGARNDVHAYLAALEYVISGNLEQSRFAPRYHGTSEYIAHPIQAGKIILWRDRTEYVCPSD
jgi:terpene synthase-like protein